VLTSPVAVLLGGVSAANISEAESHSCWAKTGSGVDGQSAVFGILGGVPKSVAVRSGVICARRIGVPGISARATIAATACAATLALADASGDLHVDNLRSSAKSDPGVG